MVSCQSTKDKPWYQFVVLPSAVVWTWSPWWTHIYRVHSSGCPNSWSTAADSPGGRSAGSRCSGTAWSEDSPHPLHSDKSCGSQRTDLTKLGAHGPTGEKKASVTGSNAFCCSTNLVQENMEPVWVFLQEKFGGENKSYSTWWQNMFMEVAAAWKHDSGTGSTKKQVRIVFIFYFHAKT